MRFSWTIGSLPELGHLPDRERRALLRSCVSWRTYGAIAGRSAFAGLVAMVVAAATLPGSTPMSVSASLGGAALLLAAAATWQYSIFRIRIALRSELLRGLRGTMLPVCLRCGYDLRAIRADRCPECGAPTRERRSAAR